MKKTLIDFTPALVDITPTKNKCGNSSPMCPAMYVSDVGTYVIVGRTVDVREGHPLYARVGKDETAIEISKQLVDDAIASKTKG